MLECPSLYNKKIHFSFFAFYILSFFIWALCLLYTVFTTSILKEGFNATLPHCSALASCTFRNIDNGTIKA